MGDDLFLILEYLLPMTNPIITNTLDTLASSSSTANGYTLLWTLLQEFIPMLDTTTPTQLQHGLIRMISSSMHDSSSCIVTWLNIVVHHILTQ